jgi:acyl-CoA dehydrogenase
LADACAELQALYELGLHALWSVYESPSCSLVDALAFRWVALDVARRILRTAHQALGAVGLCDEHDLTISTLTVRGRLRLPYHLGRTMSELVASAERVGFDSLYTPTDAVLAG